MCNCYTFRLWEKCLVNKHCVPALKVTGKDDKKMVLKSLKRFENYVESPITTPKANKHNTTTTSTENNLTPTSLFPPQVASTPHAVSATNLNTPLHQLSPIYKNATNISSPETQKKQGNITGFKFQPPLCPTSSSTSELSRTSLMMKAVIGDIPLIYQYNKTRKEMKANPCQLAKEKYLQIIAEVEVKLKLAEENIKKKLKNLELSCIGTNSTALSMIPKSENELAKYKNILTLLKYCAALKKELDL